MLLTEQKVPQSMDKNDITHYILWGKMVLMTKPDNVHMIVHLENVRKLS